MVCSDSGGHGAVYGNECGYEGLRILGFDELSGRQTHSDKEEAGSDCVGFSPGEIMSIIKHTSIYFSIPKNSRSKQVAQTPSP
jgi:hypothetical protein